jgi:peptidoglycan/xylan/chitin deacetylase (PgdA/CDA1 family)
MPPQEAKKEISRSKRIIEENLGHKVIHFSFPNGRKEDFSEKLRDYCLEIGFESVASVIYGTNHGSNGSALELKRIVATSPVWMLAGELVKCLGKLKSQKE